MIRFSTDPAVAKKQMLATIFYLTAFGWVDSDFSEPEREFVRKHVAGLVDERLREAMGGADPAAMKEAAERWTGQFQKVAESIDREIQALFTESVLEGERQDQFVVAKLQLRCLELFKRFDETSRAKLLGALDEMALADGVVHANETKFRKQLRRLLAAPIEVDDADIESVRAGRTVFEPPAKLEPRLADHPFFSRCERAYSRDPFGFNRESKEDLALVQRVIATLDEQRARGGGKLAGKQHVSAFDGGEPFLDGYVHVLPPKKGRDYELIVIGDLHGCYSCLKAALLQTDFLAKVQAHDDDPDGAPETKLVLLGDYIDRGRYSFDGVLRTAMRLFVTVPEHVYLLRGNHEHYIEHEGRVLAPVQPSEAMTSLRGLASNEMFAEYRKLFLALPSMLIFDRTMFVHAGIPRDDALAAKWTDLGSLNDEELRFQMLWSDPSEVDVVPAELQNASSRFSFGARQLKSFLAKLGCTAVVRGHERIVDGYRRVYDAPDATLLSLFSAGGKTNRDLPDKSNYREVKPMALTIRHREGTSRVTPFAIDWERYNDPKHNRLLADVAR